MTLEQARTMYEELRQKYEAQLSSFDVLCYSEIYCENEKFDKVYTPDEAVIVSLDVNVYTEAIGLDNGICFCASAEVSKCRVDDDAIIKDAEEFEKAICEFIEKLNAADDTEALIRAEITESEVLVEKMMREFDSNMKKTSLAVAIAVGAFLVVAAVALVLHFLA